MKTWIVTIEIVGLTGTYRSQVDVKARDEKSARTKAGRTIGNRDGVVLSVAQAMTAGAV